MRRGAPILTITSVFLLCLSGTSLAVSDRKFSGVVLGTDHHPIAYANVIVLGTKNGGLTNEHGAFEIKDVDPGTYDVRVLALGFEPVTRRVVIDFASSAPCTLMVDGPGIRPREPFRPIPPELVHALKHVKSGQSFRLDPDPHFITARDPDPEGLRIGPYRILSRGGDLSKAEAAHLGDLLSKEDSYWHPFVGEKKLCETSFRHGLRLASSQDTVECAFCLGCGELQMVLNGRPIGWGNHFDPIGRDVKSLFDRVLSDSSTGK